MKKDENSILDNFFIPNSMEFSTKGNQPLNFLNVYRVNEEIDFSIDIDCIKLKLSNKKKKNK